VGRNESGQATQVVFSGGTSVQELENSATTVEYVRGSDYGGGVGGILYTLRGAQPSYTHYNRRGDVTAKTDGAGAITYQASYEAFGTRTHEAGATDDRQKANTKEEDPTGLLNEGFRYRDLETGTFITRDPAGFVDGPNLYCYVRQNPWTSFDPEGLASEEFRQEHPILNFFLDTVHEISGAIIGMTTIPSDAPKTRGLYTKLLDESHKVDSGYYDPTRSAHGLVEHSAAAATMILLAPESGAVEASASKITARTADDVSTVTRGNPQDILYTQDSVSPNFGKGGTIKKTTDQLISGEKTADDITTINVVEHQGKLKSLDNRRLKALKDAGVTDAPLNKKDLNDPAVRKEFIQKNDTTTGGKSVKVETRKQREARQRQEAQQQQ
jgi:RHS repeat-associated protein